MIKVTVTTGLSQLIPISSPVSALEQVRKIYRLCVCSKQQNGHHELLPASHVLLHTRIGEPPITMCHQMRELSGNYCTMNWKRGIAYKYREKNNL